MVLVGFILCVNLCESLTHIRHIWFTGIETVVSHGVDVDNIVIPGTTNNQTQINDTCNTLFACNDCWAIYCLPYFRYFDQVGMG